DVSLMTVAGVGSTDDNVYHEEPSPLDSSDRAFWIGLSVVLLSLVSAFATYLILTGLTPIAPRGEVVFVVLSLNVLLIFAMLVVVTLQCIGLWRAWRDQVAGARLHIRIVALFSIIAAVPAILLAFAATTTFSRSLDGWFSVKTRAIIDNSLDVAKAYLDEHGQVIRSDIVNMVHDLDSAPENVRNDPRQLQQLVMIQAGLRDLPVAYMTDATGTPLLTAIEDARLPYVKPPESIIRQAEDGQVPIITPANSNRVAAIAKLENFPGRYLYVTRGVSAKVMR